MTTNRWGLPHLGLGVGLRPAHQQEVVIRQPTVDFFEIFPENYMFTEGRARHTLQEIAEKYPVTVHAIAMSVGSTDPLNMDYLRRLRALVKQVKAPLLSDHLCWTGVDGINLHSVIPMPMTEASLQHVTERVKRLQDYFGRPLFLENSPGYLAWRASTMSEVEFLVRLAEAADCGILLDLNNLYQAAFNYGFDPVAYLDALPVDRIGYQHVGGHSDHGKYLLDTHDAPVKEGVWDLYAHAETRTGGRTTLLEWDAKLPPLDELLTELHKARGFQRV